MYRVKRSGIYKIENILNGKFYIGRSKNLDDRRVRHFSHLRKGIHHNQHLQKSFQKYGQSAFLFTILELTENLVEKEQEYFINLNCGNHKLCYNIRDIADKVQRDETRYRRVVSQFDLDGNFIKTYKSIKDAANENNIKSCMITRVLKGHRKSSGGFLSQPGTDIAYKPIERNVRKIIQKSLDGKILNTFESIKDIEQYFGKDSRHVSCVLNGKRLTAYGFKWEFETKNEEILSE